MQLVRRKPSPDDRHSKSPSHLWIRLSAFLSMRSPNTQDTYMGIVREWCLFLGSAAGSAQAAQKMVQATDLHAIAFKNWLEKRPGEHPRAQRRESTNRSVAIRRPRNTKKVGLEHTLSNATIAKKFAALRRIYRMLMASELGVTQNPFDSDRVPAPPKDSGRKRPTEMLDFSMVKRIIESTNGASPKGFRDKAIMCALFGGALRRSEVVALRVGDVRRTSQGTSYLYLRSTKAKKDAEQALPAWAARTIEKLRDMRLKEGAGTGDFLFVSYTGRGGSTPTPRPVSASGVYKLFKACCVRCGAGKFLSPHSARATAITRLLAEGIPHREVQAFSRHSSIQMVELYDKRRLNVDESPAKGLDFGIKS